MTRLAPSADSNQSVPQAEPLLLTLDGTHTMSIPRHLLTLALRAGTCERDPWETALAPACSPLDDLPLGP